MKLITLSRGKRTKVSNRDYASLNKYKWHAKETTPGSGAFYAARTERPKGGGNPKTYYMHRQIMNCPANKEVHHKNTNTLDNRRKNLEKATPKQKH